MSQPTGPTGPEMPQVLSGTHQELRRRGRVFGLTYALDIRITTISDPEEEIARPPPLLTEARPLATRLAAEPREATQGTAPEGIGQWESEGGR